MTACLPLAAALLFMHALPVSDAIRYLHGRPQALNIAAVERDAERLADLAEQRIAEIGLGGALEEFSDPPWTREANALYLWGITTGQVSWFDAGHPEVVGLDIGEMSDLRGRPWAELALASARGTGSFVLLFPHPRTRRAAQSVHHCFMLEDGERVLCAGGFLSDG